MPKCDYRAAAAELAFEVRAALARGARAARLPKLRSCGLDSEGQVCVQDRFVCGAGVAGKIYQEAVALLHQTGLERRRVVGMRFEYFIPDESVKKQGVGEQSSSRGPRLSMRFFPRRSLARRSLGRPVAAPARGMHSRQTRVVPPSASAGDLGRSQNQPKPTNRGRKRLRRHSDVDDAAQSAVDQLVDAVRATLNSGAVRTRLPPVKGKGSVQETFHVGNINAELIHRRARARLSLAGLLASRGPGNSLVYSDCSSRGLGERLQECTRVKVPKQDAAVLCACGDALTGATLKLDGGSAVPLGPICCRCVRAAVSAISRSRPPHRIRRKSAPAPAPVPAISAACAAEAVGIVPLISRLRRSLGGSCETPVLCIKRESADGFSVKNSRARTGHSGQTQLAVAGSQGTSGARSSRFTGVWKDTVSGKPAKVPLLLGDDCLPGWSARLVCLLGDTAHAAKPLACTDRRVLRVLTADASQLAAEFRPVLRCLADSARWGVGQDLGLVREQSFARALCPAQILSVLWSLPGRSMAVPSSIPDELLQEIETIRSHRADALLAALTAKACRIARTLDLG